MTDHVDEHPGDNYSPPSPRYSPSSSASSPSRAASVEAPLEPSPEGQDESREALARQLPRLPNPRPRALTPPGFRDADIDADPDADFKEGPEALFQESAAYFKIPPNLRRDIIRLAFGDLRLHIDLSYVHPEPPYELIAACHCGIHNMRLGDSLKGKERADIAPSKVWQWWSSICHRHAPGAVGPMTRRALVGPWDDRCRRGFAKYCLEWRDADDPSACYIGIMGWLLSCRQNYAESINLLYSTNTFTTRNELLIMNLPQLLLPKQLSVISSLEISWPLKTRPVRGEDALADLDEHHLKKILQFLSSEFPALRRLYLSLEESFEITYDIYSETKYARGIQRNLDQFIKRMPDLTECAFAVPMWVFDYVYEEAASKPLGDGWSELAESYRQVWRNIDGETSIIRLPYVNSYPHPPYHLTHTASQVPGYWFLEGSNAPDPPSPPTRPTHNCLPEEEDIQMMIYY